MVAKPKNKVDKFWNMAKNEKQNTGEIYLYGPIASSSWWDDVVSPKQFKKDLDALGNVSDLNVYVNSGGGDVFAGQAIHSMLKRHKAKVNVHVDGLAASIASVIAMAGDTVTMPRNAMMMIHKPWSFAMGNSTDMRKMADDLDKIGESIVAAYQDKTMMDAEEIRKMMEDETWMTADEAMELGFCDCVAEEKQMAASIENGSLVFNGQAVALEKFYNTQALFAKLPTTIPVAGIETNKKEESKVMDFVALLASLPEEHQALVNAEMAKAADVLSATEQTLAETKAALEAANNKVAELTPAPQEPSEEEFLNTLPEAFRARYMENARIAKDAMEAAAALKDEAEAKEFVAKASAFDALPVKAEEFGPILRKASATLDAADYEYINALLVAANNIAKNGATFTEVGTAQAGDGSVVDKLDAIANELVAKGECATKEKAFLKALEQNPELYAEYEKAATYVVADDDEE